MIVLLKTPPGPVAHSPVLLLAHLALHTAQSATSEILILFSGFSQTDLCVPVSSSINYPDSALTMIVISWGSNLLSPSRK
jgi:hypothetical protein